MATSARIDKPFEVENPDAKFLGDGVYVWLDMAGFLIVQRQPQYAEDQNYWRLTLFPEDVAYLLKLTGISQ